MLAKLILKIKEFFLIIKNIKQINNDKPKVIFFSENKTYLKYAHILIEVLIKKFPNQIYYVSCDAEDRVDSENIKNIFVGKGLMMQIFFFVVNGENLFLTLTDLDNSIIKKNKYIKNYVYFFHSPVSTIKNYTPKAFDNYDTILCNGKFQVEEIRFRENLKNLKQKKIVNTGYFYFDYLKEKIDLNKKDNKVLIAPSWNYSQNNFINENFIDLINILLSKGEKVIFRPHPEHLKRSKKILSKIRENSSNLNFYFDNDKENFLSMQQSKCLITDSSGIALEYLMILKKPVLYLDENDKIHNTDINDFEKIRIIDYEIKNKFGNLFNKNDFTKIDSIINDAILRCKYESKNIDYFINENFYNHGKTKIFLENNLDQILKNKHTNH